MADTDKHIARFSLLLAASAGYCDTSTFVGAHGTFSAHVTGNFIVFAAEVVLRRDGMAWIKLITFPVFIAAVITAGWLANRSGKRKLLLWEGLLLIIAGAAALCNSNDFWYTNAVVMLIVFAMGLQNALGRIFPTEVFGPTTVMTGHVTQTALDLRSLILNQTSSPDQVRQNLTRQSVLLGGFLIGCVLGGLMTRQFGLAAVVLPGLVVFALSFLRRNEG